MAEDDNAPTGTRPIAEDGITRGESIYTIRMTRGATVRPC